MPCIGKSLGDAKHIALHTAKGKIFKNQKSEAHWLNTYGTNKVALYAKMPAMLKLLIVKTSSMGDVIHNLPIINDILRHYPDAQIDWVVEQSFADIVKLHPHVHRVLPVAVRQWRKALFSGSTWQAICDSRKAISASQYDIVLDTQGLLKSAWISHWAKGVRHGYDSASAREPLASLFYQQRHQVSKAQHAVVRNRSLAALALGYSMPPAQADAGIAGREANHQLSQTVIALHGSSRDSKLWPTAQWIALCNGLANDGLQVLLPWASAQEQRRAQQIAQSCSNATVLPACNLHELAHIIAQAKLAIGVDTGLAHLAVALNIPTIGIYTDTDPNKTGLYTPGNPKVVNLGGIALSPSVKEVLQQVERLSQ
jgi:heptosyltransferase I